MRFPSRRFLKIVAALLLLPSIVGGVFLIRYYYIFNGIIEGKLAKIHGQGENEIYAAPTTLFPGKRMPAPELLDESGPEPAPEPAPPRAPSPPKPPPVPRSRR